MRCFHALLLAFLGSAIGAQTTWFVDVNACIGAGSGTESDPFCTIQQGVDAAVGGDTVLVGPGLYTEDVRVPGIALTIRGAGTAATQMCGLAFAALEVLPGSKVVLADLTISGPLEPRAGVVSRQASLTVLGCRFRGTRNTVLGGAIQAEDTELVVFESAFEGLGFTFRGGAIGALRGTARIEGCWFTDLQAAYGGAIFVEDCPLVLSESVFQDCIGESQGGAVRARNGPVRIDDCTFRRNRDRVPYIFIPQSGGALWMEAVEAIIVRCSFDENSMFHMGGAIFFDGGSIVLEHSTFTQNFTNDLAGTVAVFDADVHVRHCDFRGNEASAGWGGALYVDVGTGDEVTIEDCYFAQNRAAEGGAVCIRKGFAQLARCRFFANRAGPVDYWERGYGGGLFVGGTPTAPPGLAAARVSHSVFHKNWAVGDDRTRAGRGAGLYGPVEALNCTFQSNVVTAYHIPDLPTGGATAGGAVLRNCIAWQNVPDALEASTLAEWTDLQEAWPGAGNFVREPAFRNPDSGDFRLLPTSPCIDRGDPTQFDADGSRLDVGAFAFELDATFARFR